MSNAKAVIAFSDGASITIEGSDSQVLREVENLIQRKQKEISSDLITGSSEWTQDSINVLLQSIPPSSRDILQELAKKPLGYSLDILKDTLQLNGNEIGGKIGSISKILLRNFPNFPKIVRREAGIDGNFLMDNKVAEFITATNDYHRIVKENK
jgi:hypothetical protein